MVDLLRKQTVLVVDDAPENVDILNDVLKGDYRVRVANSGEKAIEIVYSDDPPDLVLLDIMMPGLSGLEVCRRIKANPDRRLIPIIFVTAMNAVEDEQQGLAVGAVDYIAKPISPPIVRARVSTHLALYDQTRELERMVQQRTSELSSSRHLVISNLSRAVEYRDNETGNHILRMAHYARLVGQTHGLGPKAIELIFQTAPLHDIGKIGIPDSILLKPGKLDDEERGIMQRHSAIGAEIIGDHHDSDLLHVARTIALTHHERWDGAGYPRGLKGNDIPIEGRIAAIADVFDALISERIYKPAYTFEESLKIMDEEDGHHFDPALMQAFRENIAEVKHIIELYSDDRGTMPDFGMPMPPGSADL